MDLSKKRIILSKTNRIGDVIVGLPVAGHLKQVAPDCHITMLVTDYTKHIAQNFPAVDDVVSWDDPNVKANPALALKKLNADIIIHLRAKKNIAKAAKKAGIPLRVGATNRIYNWLYCNKLCRVNRTRHAPYHDSQLDMQLILPLIRKPLPSTDDISKLLRFKPSDKSNISTLIDHQKFNLILHPKCATHAGKREWPLENFAELIRKLDPEQFKIFITGTESEGKEIRDQLLIPFAHVTDLSGKLSLDDLTSFIQSADGLIAGSTGPLHIAAASSIHALGLYTPLAGHNPERWKPLGEKAEYLVSDKKDCRACKPKQTCPCIKDITPDQVLARILSWVDQS